MNLPGGYLVQHGFPDTGRNEVAELFWDAFSGKFGGVMGPRARATAFLSDALQPDYALTVCDAQGRVVGVAGLKTCEGGLVCGGMAELRSAYGFLGALWRGPLLDLLDRPVAPGELVLDGLFVARAARDRGIGTTLVKAVLAEARRRQLDRVRLEVVDGNLRARALYERLGFATMGAQDHGPLRLAFGFRRATRMECRVPPAG
jgi:ribosomal protein S18 acetylase RimI-like enzyme